MEGGFAGKCVGLVEFPAICLVAKKNKEEQTCLLVEMEMIFVKTLIF